MKKHTIILQFLCLFSTSILAQSGETGLRGRVVNEKHEPISFATLTLFNQIDSSLSKAGYSAEDGSFLLTHMHPGIYYLNISFVGYDTYILSPVEIENNNMTQLNQIAMSPFITELGEVIVTTTRPLVEVKPDKTVFNVEGSINAIGNNALELLRKAPGVVVDNNDRLMLVGKSGVKVYIDGRQSILTGDDLANYLKSLQSTQIEAIEVITQPSSRYEASGNAGIINIRLIKDMSLGTNANISLGYNQAIHSKFNGNISLNNRTKFVNAYGKYNYALGEDSQYNFFERTTPDLFTDQEYKGGEQWENNSFRAGIDITASPNATFGVLFDGFMNEEVWNSKIHTVISPSAKEPPTEFLEGTNRVESDRDNYNINGNYKFDNKKGAVFNIDVDYGKYSSKGNSYQPNYYYNSTNGELTGSRIFSANTYDN